MRNYIHFLLIVFLILTLISNIYSGTLCPQTFCEDSQIFNHGTGGCVNRSSIAAIFYNYLPNCCKIYGTLICENCRPNFYRFFYDDGFLTCLEKNSAPNSVNIQDGYARGLYFTGNADGIGIANKCLSPCLTCTQSATNCASCISGNPILESSGSTCRNTCNSNLYAFTNTDGSISCISQSDYYVDNGVRRYYLTSGSTDGTGTATKCQSPCITCVTSVTNCESCQYGKYLLTISGSKTCISLEPSNLNSISGVQRGFYSTDSVNGTGAAYACESPCITCITRATNCVSCQSGSYLITYSGSVTCISSLNPSSYNSDDGTQRGFYSTSSSASGIGTAYKCVSPCVTCLTSASNCNACASGSYLLLNSGSTTCFSSLDPSNLNEGPDRVQRGFYSPDTNSGTGSAYKCQSPCVICSTTNDNCDRCEFGSFLLTKTEGSMTCISSTSPSNLNLDADGVQRGFFTSGSTDGTGIATKCQSPCLTCLTSATNCVSCQNGSYLFTNSGSKTCISSLDPSNLNLISGVQRGFYSTDTASGTGTAYKCQSPCITCVTSATNCVSCQSDSYLLTYSGSVTCITSLDPSSYNSDDGTQRGFYSSDLATTGTGIAHKCQSPCLKCVSSASNCNACVSGSYLLLNSGSTTCIASLNPSNLNEGPDRVQRGFYSLDTNSGTGSAYKCQVPCVKCSNNYDNCGRCELGSFLLTKTDGSTTCISSTSPSNLNMGADGVQRGFFTSGSTDGTGTANKCQSPCITCVTSATNCVSCQSGSYLLTNSGSITCISSLDPSNLNLISGVQRGFYSTDTASGTGTAYKCHSPCITCVTSALNCNTCVSGSYILLNGGSTTCISSLEPSSLNQEPNGVQ
jgi:hypothetical protein